MNVVADVRSDRRKASAVGRKPSADPKKHPISFRVNAETLERLQRVLDDEQRPGLDLSISDIARMLMFEGLEQRPKKRR